MRDPLPRVQRGLAAALRDRRTQLSAAAFVLTALACYLYVLVGNIITTTISSAHRRATERAAFWPLDADASG